MKTHFKCGHVFLPENIVRRANGRTRCRTCRNMRQREWSAKNPEKVATAAKKYRAANPDKIRAEKLQAYHKNSEKGRARSKAYYEAHRNKVLARCRENNYGLGAQEHFESQIRLQGNRCDICKKLFVTTPSQDHDHDTKQLRGVLCDRCNQGIGFLLDSPKLLRRAADYLDIWRRRDGRKTETAISKTPSRQELPASRDVL